MGRKSLVVLAVFVLVLAGIFVAADRLAANAAEERIAAQTATEMASRKITSARPPDVSVGGFPFLTQVLAGEYEKVTIDVDGPQTGDVKLQRLTIVADTVRAPLKALTSGQGQITADTVTGTARMDWAAVESLVDRTSLRQVPGLDFSQVKIDVKNDKLTLAAPVRFAGFQFTVEADGTLTVADGAVRVQIERLRSNAGGATAAVSQQFLENNRDRFNLAVRVPDLPYDLKINRVETSSGGVRVTASAQGVVLAGRA